MELTRREQSAALVLSIALVNKIRSIANKGLCSGNYW
jgi:hypothetical protein